MLFTLSDMTVDFGAKPTASEISVKTLLSLSKRARHLNQPETLGGSAESLESYYKMIRQFAAIAQKFRHLIPADFDSDAILTLADYLLNMEIRGL